MTVFIGSTDGQSLSKSGHRGQECAGITMASRVREEAADATAGVPDDDVRTNLSLICAEQPGSRPRQNYRDTMLSRALRRGRTLTAAVQSLLQQQGLHDARGCNEKTSRHAARCEQHRSLY